MSTPDVAEALPPQDMWEAMQYLEANILGNPRLPSSVKFLIGLLAAHSESRRKHVSIYVPFFLINMLVLDVFVLEEDSVCHIFTERH